MRETLTPQRGIEIQQTKVTTLLKKTKIGKAAGPDAICGRTLHYCAEQLSEAFTVIFQKCADSGDIPDLWKTSTVIPIPKTKSPKDLNEFRPIALMQLEVI